MHASHDVKLKPEANASCTNAQAGMRTNNRMKKFILGLMLAALASGAFAQKEGPPGSAAEGDPGPPLKSTAPSIKTLVKIFGTVAVVVVVASSGSSSTTNH